MSIFSMAFHALRLRILGNGLAVLALASGIALLCAVLLLSTAYQAGLDRNTKGVDLVVGAKGSALQLVLSTLYHADVPLGNIAMEDAEKLSRHPRVASAIPLVMGDNYRGFRIVGTAPAYIDLYRGTLEEGTVFEQDFQAVAGSATGLEIGAQFAAIHGMAAAGTDIHDDHLFTVTGILKPTGTVLDRLILTTIASVQDVHHHHHDDEDEHEHEHEDADETRQVTALFLKLKSPVDLMNLPREINRSTNVMAAVPSYEMARVSKSLGLGRDVMMALGYGFMALSALVMLAVLASGLAARRYDLGVMRVFGASPRRIFGSVMAEGALLALAGTICGLAAGHMLAYCLARHVAGLNNFILAGDLLRIGAMDGLLLLAGLLVGMVAALIPAVSAMRLDVALLLSRGRG